MTSCCEKTLRNVNKIVDGLSNEKKYFCGSAVQDFLSGTIVKLKIAYVNFGIAMNIFT